MKERAGLALGRSSIPMRCEEDYQAGLGLGDNAEAIVRSRLVYTAYALVKFIDSRDSELRFRNFRIRQISSRGDIEDALALFPGARINGTDWLYERAYQDSEVAKSAYGFGRIPGDVEDTLLLLRLYRPGDIIFTRHSIREPSGALSIQFPQRIATEITTTSFFRFSQTECDDWDDFKSELTASQSWESRWFKIARRFFLYGGAKEFNPEWGDVDRVVDYMIALEAMLVPERGYGIGQRLRKRAVTLLGLRDDAGKDAERFLGAFYEVRSTLVHGSPLAVRHEKALKQMRQFELLVRRVVVAALRQIPPDEDSRKKQLAGLYDVPLKALVQEAARLLKEIEERL